MRNCIMFVQTSSFASLLSMEPREYNTLPQHTLLALEDKVFLLQPMHNQEVYEAACLWHGSASYLMTDPLL
jgi:hypothetical protein